MSTRTDLRRAYEAATAHYGERTVTLQEGLAAWEFLGPNDLNRPYLEDAFERAISSARAARSVAEHWFPVSLPVLYRRPKLRGALKFWDAELVKLHQLQRDALGQ